MKRINSRADRIRVLEARTKAQAKLARKRKHQTNGVRFVVPAGGQKCGTCFKGTWKKDGEAAEDGEDS